MKKKALILILPATIVLLTLGSLMGTPKAQAAVSTTKITATSASKSAASFMDFIAKKKALTSAQKNEAKKAAKLLKTGKLGATAAPSWFTTSVKLGSPDDATSAANIAASLPNLISINQKRAKLGEKRLKISLISTAISMIDSDYQKRGGLAHPQYYHYAGNLENLAAGSNPVTMWLNEKANWKWDVKKTPSLARYQFSPNWSNAKYTHAVLGTNGYKTAGHYTNIVNKKHRVMGMAHMTQSPDYGYVDAYNATNKGTKSAITLTKYRALVKEWLAKKG